MTAAQTFLEMRLLEEASLEDLARAYLRHTLTAS